MRLFMKPIVGLLFHLVLALCITQSFQYESNMETDPVSFLKGDWIMPELSELQLHIVPHTHDDIGWLKTVDQYYYGSAKQITNKGVQYILDSIVPVLNKDPSKRFIYVEIGFFQRWWNEQDDNMKSNVKTLVQNGQLEFINGGYCMNDEAAVYYEDSIDQMTLGHNFLLQNFGVVPTIGWHIDPFGHASAQAALFAQMGFTAFYFSRIDYQDQIIRLGTKSMEMVWVPNTSQGVENAIFTHVTYFQYGSPEGFDFDVIAINPPIQDDPTLEGYNVPLRADEFLAWFRLMQNGYRSSHLMHCAGGDFHYMAAGIPFKNWDKLFAYLREHPELGINPSYSTPSEYLSAIYPLSIQYPTKNDDFFPYADVINAYWTGYFSSRTSVKGLVRQEGRLLQAIKRLATQATWQQTSPFILNNFAQVDKAIYQLEEAMAIGQHHDAVTGTERQLVAEDYKWHFAVGENGAKQGFLYPYFQEKIQKDLGLSGVQLSTCNLNTSTVFCDVTYNNLQHNTPVLLTIYNSGHARNSTIRVKVPNGNVQVVNSTGVDIPTDVICSNSTDATDCDLFFTDAFTGFQTAYYYLSPSTVSNQVAAQSFSAGQTYQLNSQQTFTTESMSSFAFKYCQDAALQNCYSSQFNVKYDYYEAYQDPKGPLGEFTVDGAYIFRPSNNTKTAPLSYDTPTSGSIYQGKNLLHIHLTGSKIISDMRIYNDMTNGIEVQTFVNSIPVDDGIGKEVVIIVEVPSINNDETFYTDSMGMEMQKRVLNYRPSWPLIVTQPVSGNYYPIQSALLIQDITTNESLAIMPDRAQGGASIYAGEVELLIHRRLLYDDNRGVGEPLNELDWDGQGMRQWVTHTLLFNKPGVLETSHRQVQINNDMANIVLLAPTTEIPYYESTQETEVQDSFTDLDPYVKLLSRPLSTSKFLLRFQNMDEVNTRNVDTSVFARSSGSGKVVEMSLTANQAKSDMVTKKYNWNNLGINNPNFAKTDYLNSNQFELRPLEIRTFIVDFGSEVAEDTISI